MPPHIWQQNYNPYDNVWLSTIVAAVPLLLLFYLLAVRRTAAHIAATLAAMTCALIATTAFHMPLTMAAGAVAAGWVYGIIRVGWVVLAAVFVYELCVESGHFEIIKHSIGGVTADRRLQVLLIAFAFGAVLEGSGGGGAPVAIAGSMMIGLGFDPFAAALLCLIANTAPVAFGGLGNPVRTLTAVTEIPAATLSAMMGRILPLTALILPFWLIRSMCSWRQMRAVWPGLLCAGVTFASIQFYWSNYQDYGLVDIVAGMVTLFVLTLFFKVWKPAEIFRYESEAGAHPSAAGVLHVRGLPRLVALPAALDFRDCVGHPLGDQSARHGCLEHPGPRPRQTRLLHAPRHVGAPRRNGNLRLRVALDGGNRNLFRRPDHRLRSSA